MTRMPSFVPGVGHMSRCRTSLQTTYMMPRSNTLASLDVRSFLKPTFIKLNTPLPASAAACERLFGAAGRVFVPRRGRISDKRFEQQLLAYSCCNDSRHCHAKDVIHPYSVHQSTVCTSCFSMPRHSRSVFEGRVSGYCTSQNFLLLASVVWALYSS